MGSTVCQSCPAGTSSIVGSTVCQSCPTLKIDGSDCKVIYLGYGSNCTILSVTATGGSSQLTYKWSPGNLTGATVQVCPTKTTTYQVTATNANGCKKSKEVKVKVIDVRCGNMNDKVSICHNHHTLYVDKNAVAAHLAQGDKLGFCGVKLCEDEDEHEPEHEENTDNDNDHDSNYAIQGASGGTQATRSKVLSPVDMFLHPNPAENSITLHLTVDTEGDALISLMDITGKQVFSAFKNLYEGRNDISIDISTLPSGIYLCHFRDGLHAVLPIKLVKK